MSEALNITLVIIMNKTRQPRHIAQDAQAKQPGVGLCRRYKRMPEMDGSCQISMARLTGLKKKGASRTTATGQASDHDAFIKAPSFLARKKKAGRPCVVDPLLVSSLCVDSHVALTLSFRRKDGQRPRGSLVARTGELFRMFSSQRGSRGSSLSPADRR